MTCVRYVVWKELYPSAVYLQLSDQRNVGVKNAAETLNKIPCLPIFEILDGLTARVAI